MRKELKEIMNDKEERIEFVGGFLCCLLFILSIYILLWVFA